MGNLLKGYWKNFDRTYFGIKWGAELTIFIKKKMLSAECDHSFRFTNEYFSKWFVLKRIYHLWLHKHYCCDCEVITNSDWRDGLDWREESEEFKEQENHIMYKDGTRIDLRLYKNGLKAGNLLQSKSDIYINNLDGNVVEHFPKDDIFIVLRMDPIIGYDDTVILLNLEQSKTIVCKDNDQIFNKYELIDAIVFYKNKLASCNSGSEKIGLYHCLGTAYSNEGDHNSAINYYQKAVDLSIEKKGPNSGTTFLSMKYLANEYFDVGKYDLAIRTFETAIMQNKASANDITYKGYQTEFKEKIKYSKKMLKKAN